MIQVNFQIETFYEGTNSSKIQTTVMALMPFNSLDASELLYKVSKVFNLNLLFKSHQSNRLKGDSH